MRVKNLCLFLIALSSIAMAKPVGRVESMHGDKKLFRQTGPSAPYYQSHLEQDADIGHHFRTDANSMASIRFFLGGNVGLGKGCEIEVINDRDAKILSQGNYWMKFDQQDLKNNPIKIQTAGGVMGIRGTEFVLKVGEDGATELSLLEGNVEVEAVDGETFEAEPGMRVSFGGGQGLRYKLYEVEKLLGQVREELGPEFYELRQTLRETRKAIRDAKLQIRTASAEARAGLVSARLGALEGKRALRESGLSGDGSLDAALAQMAEAEALMAAYERGEGLEEMDEPVVEESGREVPPALCGSHPSLKWPGTPNQKYAVLIINSDDDQIYWVAETVGPEYTYPAEAEPLNPGRYTLRVVPLGANRELKQATDFPIEVQAE